MTQTIKGWQLNQYPEGLPTTQDVSLTENQCPDLEEGQLLIRNEWLSVDPYMRGRMIPVKSYIPPFQLGKLMEGGAVGEVIESKHPDFQVGDKVLHMLGWRDHAITNGEGVTKLPQTGLPIQAFLGAMGLTGLTAWGGLYKIGEVKEGDVVFVSGAAGAVGSIVLQLAKLKGATVIGSVGSDEKADYIVNELGADKAINYKTCGDLTEALQQAAPDGITLYFDNVGGDHLRAAIANTRDFARLVMCGMIEVYNAAERPGGPNNLSEIIRRRLKVQGFIASDFMPQFNEFAAEVGAYLAKGQLKYDETVYEGIESTFNAFLGLFSGANKGKMLVKL